MKYCFRCDKELPEDKKPLATLIDEDSGVTSITLCTECQEWLDSRPKN
jgi:hypothetical protein